MLEYYKHDTVGIVAASRYHRDGHRILSDDVLLSTPYLLVR